MAGTGKAHLRDPETRCCESRTWSSNFRSVVAAVSFMP